MREAEQHIKFCIEMYKMQMQNNRYFLHEHPHAATSWKLDDMVKLMAIEGVLMTECDMCAYGLKVEDSEGETYAKKRTRFISNSHEVIKRCGRQCSNGPSAANNHRHADLTNGAARRGQVYPR